MEVVRVNETIKYMLENVLMIISGISLVYVANLSFKFYQDVAYQVKPFLKLLPKIYKRYPLLGLLIPFVFLKNFWYVSLIYISFLLVLIWLIVKTKFIKKLHFTGRVIREYILLIIWLTIMGTLLMFKIPFYGIMNVLSLLITTMPLSVMVCGILIYPLEYVIRWGYVHKAKKKLQEYKPLVIGITGSCGKTSTKNIAYHFLKDETMVYMSQKSFNTLNGLAITINDFVNCNDLILLLEMGATKTGDISELVNFTHPEIGIVTDITFQHMNTFKSIDKIVEEKMQLIENLTGRKIAILNYDNEYIRNYQIHNDCRVITIGTSKDYAYYAIDIVHNLDGLKFKVRGKVEMNVETKLVGLHYVNNILLAIALCCELGISCDEIKESINSLEFIKNRLEVKKEGNLLIIDDSYNSNPRGFVNALEVLRFYGGKRYLITPGIVEAGEKTKMINYNIGIEIARSLAEVRLIKNTSSMYIYDALKGLGYQNVAIYNSFAEARKGIKEGCLLIENDLPDKYLM